MIKKHDAVLDLLADLYTALDDSMMPLCEQEIVHINFASKK